VRQGAPVQIGCSSSEGTSDLHLCLFSGWISLAVADGDQSTPVSEMLRIFRQLADESTTGEEDAVSPEPC